MEKCIFTKEYTLSEKKYANLKKYFEENPNINRISYHGNLCYSLDICHYSGCTILVTRYYPLKEEYDAKLEKLELEVTSDIDSQSKKVFDELENIILQEPKNA